MYQSPKGKEQMVVGSDLLAEADYREVLALLHNLKGNGYNVMNSAHMGIGAQKSATNSLRGLLARTLAFPIGIVKSLLSMSGVVSNSTPYIISFSRKATGSLSRMAAWKNQSSEPNTHCQ